MSREHFDLISGFYLIISIATFIEVWQRGRAFWSGSLQRQDASLVTRIAIFLVYPFVVLVHELGHAVATWLNGGTVVEFQWRIFWGFITHSGDITHLQRWWIALAGNLASAALGAGLLLLGYRESAIKPVVRAVALRAGYFALVFTLIVYPVMSFIGMFGDWQTIYQFDVTRVASAITLLLHTMLVALLLSWNGRVGERFRQISHSTASDLRRPSPRPRGSIRRASALAAGVFVSIAAYGVYQQPQRIPATAAPDDTRRFANTGSGRGIFTELDMPAGVVVANDVLGEGEHLAENGHVEDDFSDTSILIVAGEGERAATALKWAGRRYFFVGHDGTEFAEDDPVFWSGEMVTPEYVSDVYRTPWGPSLSIDYEGELIPDVARVKFVSILLEELERADVSTALIMRDPSDEHWPIWKRL